MPLGFSNVAAHIEYIAAQSGITYGLIWRHDPSSCPWEFTAPAADGLHIEVDRHSSPLCYLISVGNSAPHYGESPEAQIKSKATVCFGEQLSIIDRREEGRLWWGIGVMCRDE